MIADSMIWKKDNAVTELAVQERAIVTFHHAGNLAEAARLARACIEDHPRSHLAWSILGVSLAQLGRLDEAIDAFSRALDLQPADADMLCNLGAAMLDAGRVADAEEVLGTALTLKPDHLRAMNTLGNLRFGLGRRPEAIALYNKADAIAPGSPLTAYNLGTALLQAGDFVGGAAHLRRAVDAGSVDALKNYGVAMQRAGSMREAVDAFARLTQRRPGQAEAFVNLGSALMDDGRSDLAAQVLARAVELDPANPAARAQKAHAHALLCDWPAMASLLPVPLEGGPPAPPFPMLAREDDPARQAVRARTWAAHTLPPPSARPVVEADPARPLRIGYFAGDFHDHALMHLLSGVLREHDRAKVVVHLFSYGPPMQGPMREQAIASADVWHDVFGMADEAIVAKARAERLDLAVDLKGYTAAGRTSLFAGGLAPVQVNWLGYPGTLGSAAFDWILADRTVIPPEDQPHYVERVWYLPDCYQPNDDRRPIDAVGSRADHGLPPEGFVFCCFNNAFKLSPDEFELWMALLRSVPGSVLWLLATRPGVAENLSAAAVAGGVDPRRLVFAPWLPQPQHLGRLRLADLFLDTFCYNAHTTASDALWAGVPVVTLPGKQFAARVGASLVAAAGLPDCIAATRDDYRDIALALARDPWAHASLKARVALRQGPLFDTGKFTRNLEIAFAGMVAAEAAA
jgi:predicted O-linked N-acetylglucosamine transferase (SPINDLY family)